jgi:replication protein P
MKHISEIANVAYIQTARDGKETQNQLDPVCVVLVDQIFIKFALLCREYDALYADKKRLNAEKVQWVRAFTKNNIRTQKQIQGGIDETERHKYGKPPQLGQFLDWCKPSPTRDGFPNTQDAFQIALLINRQFSAYSHPDSKVDTVIRHAISQIGSMNFREMTHDKAIKTFEYNYSIACRQYIEGNLQDISKALPEKPESHPIDKVKNDEARKIAMAKMRAMLGK